jgi:hypothetical protein
MPTLQANHPTAIYFPSNAANGPSPYTTLPLTIGAGGSRRGFGYAGNN